MLLYNYIRIQSNPFLNAFKKRGGSQLCFVFFLNSKHQSSTTQPKKQPSWLRSHVCCMSNASRSKTTIFWVSEYVQRHRGRYDSLSFRPQQTGLVHYNETRTNEKRMGELCPVMWQHWLNIILIKKKQLFRGYQKGKTKTENYRQQQNYIRDYKRYKERGVSHGKIKWSWYKHTITSDLE